jgi:WD40 repeat protein
MRLAALMALLIVAGCEQAGRTIGGAIGPRKAIAELPYAGDRPDAPPLEERGNAQFTDARFDDTGKLLITLAWFGSARVQVWNAENGALVSGFDAIVPNPGSRNIWMIDSARRRLFARNGKNDGFALFDLMTGKTISSFADTPPAPAFREPYAVGLTAEGTHALIFKPGTMELWDVESARMVKQATSPFTTQRFFPACTGGTPGSTYTDKPACWEWSADHRTLAAAFTPEEPVQASTQYMLIDATTLDVVRIKVPDEILTRSFTSFAFSPDGKWLALGTSAGLWLYDRANDSFGRFIAGSQHRSNALAPMRFLPDSRRLIALGDQLQISVYDTETGIMLGRHDPAFENWEGILKISDDGSRVVVYKILSDTFEVLDGENATRVGWVCPYFCNVLHAPLHPGYAVSPDGRRIAVSIRRGAAVWDTATDQIRFPLKDSKRKPLPYPMQQP